MSFRGWRAESCRLDKSAGWPIIIRKTFARRFLLTFRNVGNFNKRSDEDSGGRLPIVYISPWHKCTLTILLWRGCILCRVETVYTSNGVGICCFLSLTLRFLPTYLKGKDIDCNMIPAPFLCPQKDSHYIDE